VLADGLLQNPDKLNGREQLVDRRFGHCSRKAAEQAIRVGRQCLGPGPKVAKHFDQALVLGLADAGQ